MYSKEREENLKEGSSHNSSIWLHLVSYLKGSVATVRKYPPSNNEIIVRRNKLQTYMSESDFPLHVTTIFVPSSSVPGVTPTAGCHFLCTRERLSVGSGIRSVISAVSISKNSCELFSAVYPGSRSSAFSQWQRVRKDEGFPCGK